MLLNRKVFQLLFVISIGLVFWGIFRATPPKELFDQSDKVAHLIAFAGLSFTGRMAMPAVNAGFYWLVMCGLALSLECLQGLVQVSRLSSIEDAIANLAGVTIGAGVVIVARKISYEWRERAGARKYNS